MGHVFKLPPCLKLTNTDPFAGALERAGGWAGAEREFAPWGFEFPFPGSLTSTFLGRGTGTVHLIITMIKKIRTSGLSIKNSLSGAGAQERAGRRRRRSLPNGPFRLPLSQASSILSILLFVALASALALQWQARPSVQNMCEVPWSSEFGTHKTVTARFWPWRAGLGLSQDAVVDEAFQTVLPSSSLLLSSLELSDTNVYEP